MIGALLGAFATALSGGLGAAASAKAADYNYQVDLLNYYSRERERRDSINQARRQEKDTKLGSTDAQGNRTYFKPGVGWVTDLSDQTKELQGLYRNEELAQLLQDLPRKRDILNQNYSRQLSEDTQASALRNAMGRIRRTSDRDLRSVLDASASRGINKAFDQTLNEAMRSAIRSGASNSGKVAADIGRQRASMLSDAFLNNRANAKGQSEQAYQSERANLANLYNMFATRASAMPDVSYAPRNIEGAASAAQSQAAGLNQNAMAALINAFAKQGGSMQRISPDYGVANAVGTAGQAIGSAFSQIGANNQKNALYDAFAQYAGLDSNLYKSSKGSF